MSKSIDLLYKFCVNHFTGGEIHIFAARYYPELGRLLPGPVASHAQVATDFADGLQRLGLIEGSFFERLHAERPHLTAEIRGLRASYLGTYETGDPAPTAPPPPIESGAPSFARRQAADGAPRPLLELDGERLAELAHGDEVADNVYVLLRTTESSIDFVADAARDRRARLTFSGTRPTDIECLWLADSRKPLTPDGVSEPESTWALIHVPPGRVVALGNHDVRISSPRVEDGWVLAYQRSQGRPIYHFVALSLRA